MLLNLTTDGCWVYSNGYIIGNPAILYTNLVHLSGWPSDISEVLTEKVLFTNPPPQIDTLINLEMWSAKISEDGSIQYIFFHPISLLMCRRLILWISPVAIREMILLFVHRDLENDVETVYTRHWIKIKNGQPSNRSGLLSKDNESDDGFIQFIPQYAAALCFNCDIPESRLNHCSVHFRINSSSTSQDHSKRSSEEKRGNVA